MGKLRIYVDFAAPAEVMQMLREGTAGHELVFPARPVSSVLAKAERDAQFETVDVAFGQPDPGAIADSPRLRWVHISSSGFTRYDTPEFRTMVASRGIAVSNSADVYSEACAVHALSFMLAQARKLPEALSSQTPNGTQEWHALRSVSGTLRGERVVLLGYGAIAKRLVELLEPFRMSIVAYRRHRRGNESVPVIGPEQLEQELARADHIVNILPESRETRRFFDARRFGAARRGAIFYNIGRGATVDQDALLHALESGRIGAAWLDVTDPEPLPGNHPLRAVRNCFITPHIAGGHPEETKTLVRHFLANLNAFTRGEPLINRVM